MRFLLDENVPNSVAAVLEDHGHEVSSVRDIMPVASPDPVVATISEERDAILVSHDKDFRSIAPRVHMSRARFRRLSRIALKCNEPQDAQRVEKAMSLIEAEYEIARQSEDSRMIITIANGYIRTER